MRNIFTTTLRLNLDEPDERRAWEYLRGMDKKKYRSYSKVIAAAVNDYFDRQEKLLADPYLETREKEDMFLGRIMESIQNSLQRAAVIPVTSTLPPMPPQFAAETQAYSEELSAALDFADSF